MISPGMVSIPTPMGKFSWLRCVCAPQYLSAGTFTSPMESCSIRYSIAFSSPMIVDSTIPRRQAGDFVFYFFCSQGWFATPQLVLQADWQEVWHSPQPPFLALAHRSRVFMVFI